MLFNKIILLTKVKLVKDDNLKYSIPSIINSNVNFEIWNLYNIFHTKNKYITDNINTDLNIINIDIYEQFLLKLKKCNEKTLLIDNFLCTNLADANLIVRKRNIKILCSLLSPTPFSLKNLNTFNKILKLFKEPKFYFKKFLKKKGNKLLLDYYVNINNNISYNSEYLISKNTKIIQTHSYDYQKYINFENTPNSTIIDTDYTVFLDEGITCHPDYEYLGVKQYCKTSIYFEELRNFFDYFENKTNTKIIIAGHPKVKYSPPYKNFFKRQIIENKTLNLVKFSKYTLSHMSTSINFSIIYNKPIFFLDSFNYGFLLRNHINTIAKFLLVKPILISNNNYDINLHMTNIKNYQQYMHSFITSTVSVSKHNWVDIISKIDSKMLKV